jgi:hypothetical protein
MNCPIGSKKEKELWEKYYDPTGVNRDVNSRLK